MSVSVSKRNADIHLGRPFIVRLTLYNGPLIRQGFHRPYDPTFQCAMMFTMQDVLFISKAQTAHTHGCEILLLFERLTTNLTSCPFKLVSMFASYATVRFNYHLAKQICYEHFMTTYKLTKLASVLEKQSIFYGYYFQSESDKQMIQYLMDRCRNRVLELAIRSWAETFFVPKEYVNKSSDELVLLLKELKSIRWQMDVPSFISFGIFAKLDARSDNLTTPVCRAFALDDSTQTYQMLLSLHWPKRIGLGQYGQIVDTTTLYNVNAYYQNNTEKDEKTPKTQTPPGTFLHPLSATVTIPVQPSPKITISTLQLPSPVIPSSKMKDTAEDKPAVLPLSDTQNNIV